jgi:hypothetical protein
VDAPWASRRAYGLLLSPPPSLSGGVVGGGELDWNSPLLLLRSCSWAPGPLEAWFAQLTLPPADFVAPGNISPLAFPPPLGPLNQERNSTLNRLIAVDLGGRVKIKAGVFLSLILVPGAVIGQKASEIGWGPWRYTWHDQDKWSGVRFRTKCMSTDSKGDSEWAYQFKSRYDHSMAFVTKTEQGVLGSKINGFSRPEIVTLDGGALSATFHTNLHGSCEDHKELKIEVTCVEEGSSYGAGVDPCYHDLNGVGLKMKRSEDQAPSGAGSQGSGAQDPRNPIPSR